MRKIILSLAVATATLSAVPAAAQYRDHDRWDQRGDFRHDQRAVQQLLRELNQVEQRIDRSARRGIISSREALGLRREAVRIRDRLHRSARNGLNGRELQQLSFQIDRVEDRLRIERRDRDARRL